MNDKAGDALFHFLKIALQRHRRSINCGTSLQKRQRTEQGTLPRLLFYSCASVIGGARECCGAALNQRAVALSSG